MSDVWEGPGWWIASDDKWYPPELHPDVSGTGHSASDDTGRTTDSGTEGDVSPDTSTTPIRKTPPAAVLGPSDDRWQGRPILGALVSGAIYFVPIALSIAAATIAAHLFPRPHTTGDLVAWWIAVLAVPVVVLAATQRVARRALPLAVLLKMTMVFPDRAPNRLAMVRKSGSTRHLARRVEDARTNGALDEPVMAAERILALAGVLNAHDRLTRGHGERVRVFTDLIADELNLDADDRDRLRWSALLHDIGKLAVHPEILNKPDKLDDKEWEIIKNHPLEGAKLTAPLAGWLGEWAKTIAEHHEKFDGSGYPYGLKGEEISLGGRIVAVADCYDTMTTVRSYKSSMSPKAARVELAACAGTQFDPRVVRAFLDVSIGRVRPVAGPLAWLGSLPFVSSIPQAAAMVGRLAATTLAVSGAVAAGAVNTAPSLPTAPSATQTSTPPSGAGAPAPVHASAPSTTTVAAPSGRGIGAGVGGIATTSTLAEPAVDVPSAPTIGSVTVGDATVSVAFTPPDSDGGGKISEYSATCASATGDVTDTSAIAASPVVVSGLINGDTYTCTVSATNAAGTGAASAASPAVIVGTPGASTAVVAASKATGTTTGSLIVSFTLGTDNGSPITVQTATCASSDGGATATGSVSAATATPITVTGATTGHSYTCTVTASNEPGTGVQSAPSGAVIVGAPAAPSAVSAVSKSTKITTGVLSVTFTNGAGNGSPITGQTATCVSSNGGGTESGTNAGATAAAIVVSGVTTGDSYTCTVTATNARGTSLASAPSSPAVVGAPAAPTAVNAANTAAGQLTVTFTPGADHGSPALDFTAQCSSSNGGASGATTGSASPLVVAGLTLGDIYICTVTATNARGAGPSSSPSGAVTA